MNLKKQIRDELSDQGQRIVVAASLPLVPITVLAGQIFVFWFSGKEALFPDNDALMTVISCCAQIVAGLYGILQHFVDMSPLFLLRVFIGMSGIPAQLAVGAGNQMEVFQDHQRDSIQMGHSFFVHWAVL